MYVFASLEMVTNFFLKFNIDISLFNNYELAFVICLCNILQLLFYFFIFYIFYKIIHKILDWWF